MANALGVPWRLGVRLDLDTIGAPRGFSLPFNAVRWLALGFSESVCAGNRGMEEGGGGECGTSDKEKRPERRRRSRGPRAQKNRQFRRPIKPLLS